MGICDMKIAKDVSNNIQKWFLKGRPLLLLQIKSVSKTVQFTVCDENIKQLPNKTKRKY